MKNIFEKLYNILVVSYKLDEHENKDFFDAIRAQYYSDEVQSLKQYEQHLEINRLQHITSVTFLAYNICLKLKLNAKSAAKAAIMHDLFYYDWRDGENGKWHKLHGYKHPKYAALNAKELCPDLTKKEEDIIRRHMWPLTLSFPNSKEGLIVSLSDKYCATMELIYSKSNSYKQKFLRDIGQSNGNS